MTAPRGPRKLDPLRSIILRERTQRAAWLALLAVAAFLASLLLFWPATYVTDGRVLDATVVRIGTYPAAKVRGGELPILTVRLSDGSIRQVRASWATAGNCMPGSQVPIVQRGAALQVALGGCRKPDLSD